MKFKKHQVIEVHHQYGVKYFECESFVDAAMSGDYETWDYEEFANLAEAADIYGDVDEVPAKLAELLKSGGAVAIHEPGSGTHYMAAADFDAEGEAESWLAHDLHRMIVINSTEDAEDIAENYRGHEDIKVRRMAREILQMAKDGLLDEAEA